MANNSTPSWRCRECLSKGITADFASASHMKSHLSTHGYGPWRCTGCSFIGLRKLTITSHHRRSGETASGAYNDPALNTRVNQEVRECLMPHRNTWTRRTAVPSPDARALATARAAVTHHTQAPVATASAPAIIQLQNSCNSTPTTMTTAVTSTISTTTTTIIKTVTTSTNATTTATDEEKTITSNKTPVTTPALIAFANQALDIAIPFINRVNEMQDRSSEEHVHACISSLQPIIKQLRRQHTVKGHRRNVYLVASIMMFYQGLLTTDQEVESINIVVRKLRELRRDPREDL